MLHRISVALLVTTVAACSADVTAPGGLPIGEALSGVSAKGGRAASAGVVYVTSQGLYYDTFAAQDPLPSTNGPFQLLANGQTEFGPGDPGYRGGRWWVDTNGNGVQDATDHYFLCPLLGPGRATP